MSGPRGAGNPGAAPPEPLPVDYPRQPRRSQQPLPTAILGARHSPAEPPMQQLTGIDTLFLTQESERTPLYISPLLIYDPSTAPGGRVRFKGILRRSQSGCISPRLFRRHLVEVPFGIDHPYWVEDRTTSISSSTCATSRSPQPGDWRQLCIQVARLHARVLDRSRPLWESLRDRGTRQCRGPAEGMLRAVPEDAPRGDRRRLRHRDHRRDPRHRATRRRARCRAPRHLAARSASPPRSACWRAPGCTT